MPLLKNHTKFKIIKWVERVLRYKPEPIRPIIEKQRTIETLKWERIISERELLSGSYKMRMAIGLAEHLQELNVIEMNVMEEIISHLPEKHARIQAILSYVTPEKKQTT